jgi:hypothetical protein
MLRFTLSMASACWGAGLEPARLQEMVQRSVDNSNADWAAAPHYTYTARDVIAKYGKKTVDTYQVMMIEGSPYNRLTAVNDRPLSPDESAAEQQKLAQEITRRGKRRPTTGKDGLPSTCDSAPRIMPC